jgi:hypothetical protein
LVWSAANLFTPSWMLFKIKLSAMIQAISMFLELMASFGSPSTYLVVNFHPSLNLISKANSKNVQSSPKSERLDSWVKFHARCHNRKL